jgi:cytochrome oxidase Cu insertion factor (SCO1/SenC/PrrC family)
MGRPSPRAAAASPAYAFGLAALVAAAFLLAPAREAQAARWGKSYFPDVEVVTQEGTRLRFYDDLIKDKVFLISFIFTTCRDFCPLAAARLSELQAKLGDAMGRDVFFYSISIDPETDTPERLKEYARTFGAGPGWLFLTGKPEDIQALRYKLGDRGKTLGEHRNEILLGNGATGSWARNNVLGDINSLATAVRSMDPSWRPPPGAKRIPHTVTLDLADFAARPGEALYRRLCAGCHSVGNGDKVGPDLAGIAERRDRDWLLRFISNPEKLRVQKDPVALALVARFPTVRMPPLGIAPADAGDLLAYIAHLETQEARKAPLQSLYGLTTHTGEPLTPEAVKGKPVAVFFGFTHCPDVCPTTLMDWSNVLEGLAQDGDKLKVLFVSVDAERDTPAALAAYMRSFDPRITALTGGAADIARAARAFDAFYEKTASSDQGFTFDHTTNVYLVGRDGRVAATPNLRTPEADRQKMLADLLAEH